MPETIKAKIQKGHRIREDRGEGFTDSWAAVAAKVQSQPSSLPPPYGTPRIQSQTCNNQRIGTMAGTVDNQHDSEETVMSSDFRQASATQLLTFLDSNLQTPDGLPQVALRPTLENTVIPTRL